MNNRIREIETDLTAYMDGSKMMCVSDVARYMHIEPETAKKFVRDLPYQLVGKKHMHYIRDLSRFMYQMEGNV